MFPLLCFTFLVPFTSLTEYGSYTPLSPFLCFVSYFLIKTFRYLLRFCFFHLEVLGFSWFSVSSFFFDNSRDTRYTLYLNIYSSSPISDPNIYECPSVCSTEGRVVSFLDHGYWRILDLRISWFERCVYWKVFNGERGSFTVAL